MKANELKIGNWVLHEPKNARVETEVDAHDLENLQFYHDKYGHEYEPIPLTEEWLVKFGFESVNSFINNEIWRVTNYHKGNEKYGLKLFKGINDPECLYFFHGNVGLKIEYVHQLQNLYFALTGEELTIKE